MKNKNNRFDALLKYREYQEETMKHELAEVSQALDIEERKLFAIEEISRQALEEFRERQKREAPPHEIFMYHAYLRQIALDIDIQRSRVNEAAKIYNDKKMALVNASQDKSVVEKVRDKELLCKKEGFKKEEQKIMNEIGNTRFIRNN